MPIDQKKSEIICWIVDRFYEKAREDFMIGYHFQKIENFSDHLPRIYYFWLTQLGIDSQIPFNNNNKAPFDLIKIHRALNIRKGELGRWAILFKETIQESKADVDLKQNLEGRVDWFQKTFLEILWR